MNYGPTQEYALEFALKQLARLTGQNYADTRKGVLDLAARRQCRNNPGFQTLDDGLVKRSARTIAVAHSCLKCGNLYMERPVNDDGFAKRLADKCCSPYECTTCGKAFDGTQRWLHCPDCVRTRHREAWEKLPYADEQPDSMLLAVEMEQWFYSLEDYLEHCWDNEIDDPYAYLPVWGQPGTPHIPDLAEAVGQEAPEDYDFSFLKPVQAELERLVAQHCKWYEEGKTRPHIPEDWQQQFQDDPEDVAAGSEK